VVEPPLSGDKVATNQRRSGPDQDRAVDRFRFGRVVRALRQRHGWRQADLARRSGVSRSVVGRIERGDLLRVAWGDLVAVAEAVGARLDFDARWKGASLDHLLDERHAATVDATVGILRSAGWDLDVEVSFAIYGERGSIDVVGRHAATGLVAAIEVKASIGDANQTVIGLDRKARLAPKIARERGWACAGLARFLVVAEGSTSRARVARHGGTFETAFPLRGRRCLDWLRAPSLPPPSGLFFVALPNVRGAGTTRKRVRSPPAATHGSTAAEPGELP
jgi:transcriptional regulator with XRE-family HTH domain